jgi:hypothetical protein
VGFVASIIHLFRVCFIFMVIKFYVEYCVTSYFRDLQNKVKTVEDTETYELEDKPAPV